MKKSEAIREAVDRYLSPIYGKDTYQLCNCLQRLYAAGDLPRKRCIEMTNEIRYFLGHLTMVGAHGQNYDNLTEYTATAQDLRFMFAEFLALMWEDEEAEAEQLQLDIKTSLIIESENEQ